MNSSEAVRAVPLNNTALVGVFASEQSQSGVFASLLEASKQNVVSPDATDRSSQDSAARETRTQNPVLAREYSLLKIRGLSDGEINQFQEIKERACSAEDAKTFLSTLSTEELLLVQKANSYGNRLRQSEIDAMTQEGARNMLVTQDNRAYVDCNNDGIVDKGVGKTFVFPPPNAPESVKDAWQQTMDALPADQRLMASSMFILQSIQANVKTDVQGNPTGMYFPGEEGYINIFPTELADWFGLLDRIDSDLAKMQALDPTNPHLEKKLTTMESFRNNLMS